MRSDARAQGIAQFMPATAAERVVLNRFDPADALPKSAAFLRELRAASAISGSLRLRIKPGRNASEAGLPASERCRPRRQPMFAASPAAPPSNGRRPARAMRISQFPPTHRARKWQASRQPLSRQVRSRNPNPPPFGWGNGDRSERDARASYKRLRKQHQGTLHVSLSLLMAQMFASSWAKMSESEPAMAGKTRRDRARRIYPTILSRSWTMQPKT